MNQMKLIFRIHLFLLGPAFLASCPAAKAAEADPDQGHIRTQEIQIQAGWNAVFLEVDPLDTSPLVVFRGLPVIQAAAYFPGSRTTQFVSDASINLSKDQGWGVWYAPDRPEAFLKSLDAIYGGRPYLIKASRSFQWRVNGYTRTQKTHWTSDSYNLVGFPVAVSGAPTFAEFFSGSKAHNGQAIYRLAGNVWRKVNQPSGEAMRSGEAFWIFTKGSSTYEGPLKIELSLQQGLVIGRGRAGVVVRNEASFPLSPKIEHVVGDSPGVPLSVAIRAIGDSAAPVKSISVPLPAGAWAEELPVIEKGGALAVPFECRAGEMTAARRSSLLKFTSDIGTITWVPVLGLRDDLAE